MMRRALFGFFALFVLSVSAHAQETATVISEGIGKDIESAAQRAAEAALNRRRLAQPGAHGRPIRQRS